MQTKNLGNRWDIEDRHKKLRFDVSDGRPTWLQITSLFRAVVLPAPTFIRCRRVRFATTQQKQ
jgi:hypothetical protein